MPFSAINTYEEEVRQRNERHTLELQLEQAMSVYQEALEAQRVGRFESSRLSYDRLFAFDVMQPRRGSKRWVESQDNDSTSTNDGALGPAKNSKSLQLGPALRLRAMALKNFAILLVTPAETPQENIEQALTCLGEALELVGTDDKEKLVVGSLVQLLWALGHHRGARLGLEMIVQNDEGGALEPLEAWINNRDQAGLLLSPQNLKWLEALQFVAEEDEGTRSGPTPVILQRFDHLTKPKEPLEVTLEAESNTVISLPTQTWEGLISALNDAVAQTSRRYKRKGVRDSYQWSNRDLWSVSFTGILLNREQRTPAPGNETETEAPNAGEIQQTATTPERAVSEAPAGHSTIQASPIVEHQSSPAKRRRIERVTRSASLALPADFGLVDTNFASQFNGFLSLSSADCDEFMSPAYLFFEPAQDVPTALAGAADLKDILSTWDSRESTQFLAESTSLKPQKGGIMTTLRRDSEVGSDDSQDIPDEDDSSDSADNESYAVDEFVAAHDGSHIQIIRLDLAITLLNKLSLGGCTRAFSRLVFPFMDEIENLLWSRRDFLSHEQSLVLFGLYADQWLHTRSVEYEAKALRWQIVSGNAASLPHIWILAFLQQEATDASPDTSISYFENVLETEFSDEPLRFSHLTHIPALTQANAQMQVSKFKAAAAFERVMTPAGTDTQQEEEDIKLLEAMLMPQTHPKPEETSVLEFEAIQQFLHFAQPQFKMGLWYILLEKYESSGDTRKCLTGLTQIFVEAMTAAERGEPLLQTLAVAHDVGKRLMPLFQKNRTLLEDEWSGSEVCEVLKYIVKLLQTLQLFILYDDAVNSNLLQKPVTPTWTSVLAKFRELVTLWWSIFYFYWLRSVPSEAKSNKETVNDILSIIHERLGNLGYCGLADGCLLKLHCSEIVRLDWDGSALDMTQCLRCRYGLTLTLYGEGSNHHTVPQSLEYDDAHSMLPYVMRMILSRRNFNQVVMRNDTRAVLDEFAATISARDRPKLDHERKPVEDYLDSDLTPSLLQKAWNGTGRDNIITRSADIFSGLWFVQAHVLLNQYRMRRRQAYSASSARTDNLNTAAKFFLDDLATTSSRFESWTGLAQTYSYLCEDILTFGAEISTPLDAVGYCRQGLLAAMRALTIKLRGDVSKILQAEIHESMSSGLWALIGNLLVLAVLPPLSLAPLAVQQPPRPFLVEMSEANKYRIAVKPQPQISPKTAMALASKCLNVSVDPQNDWINAITQAYAAKQAGEPSLRVIGYAERALELQPSSFLDAECTMVELIWSYFRQNEISNDIARRRLTELNLGVSTEVSVEELIESTLRKLLEKDKWLHRPRYLLAKIYELDHRDSRKAQLELQHLFSLKSPTKPLVIWKMESELPGQHGVDMNQYLRYLGDLMIANEDSAGIALVARRFRRNAMEMWNHAQAYEYIYTRACMLTRKLLGFEGGQDAKLSDKLMNDLTSAGIERFEASTKAMDTSAEFSEDNKWVQALYYAVELRRLNSGISSSAMADDIVITIFLVMLKRFTQEHPVSLPSASPPGAEPAPEKPQSDTAGGGGGGGGGGATPKPQPKQAPKKKLLRKDVITAATQLLKPLQQKLSKMDDLGIPKNLSIRT